MPPTVRGGPSVQGSDERHRADHLPAHQRQQGPSPLRAAGRSDQLARRLGTGEADRPAAREVDAQAGHRDHDQEPARPARCSWTGARTAPPRRRSRRTRCAGATIRPSPRRAPGTRSRTRTCGTCASTRCWRASSATATCSPGSTRVRRCQTNSRRTAACATPARRRSRCRRGARDGRGKVPPGRLRRHVRHPGAPRPAAALRLPPRAQRRAGVVGGAEEPAGDHVGEPPRRAHRGPSAGVRDVRGLDSQGGVRRWQGHRLGLGHLRDREVPRQLARRAGEGRRGDRHAARQRRSPAATR